MRKWVRRFTSFILSQLPQKLKFGVIRSQLRVPLEMPSDFTFKIVETQEELEQAFALVYKSYLKMGYCSENEYGLRGTKYHALKSTTTLIAKYRNQVVGTLTVVRDNPTFGLPLEQVFNIKDLRRGGQRIAEITSMVIDPEFRKRRGGQVLFPLLKLMHEYTTFYFGTNKLVIAISPKDRDYYTAILLFADLRDNKPKDYFGAPAIVLSLDLDTAESRFHNEYNGKSEVKNLYYFFRELNTPYIHLPERPVFLVNDQIVNQRMYIKLFVEKLKIIESEVIEIFDTEKRLTGSFRFDIDAPARILTGQEHPSHITAFQNISANGFKTKYIENLALGDFYNFLLYVSPTKKLKISGKVMWQSPDLGVGFQIVTKDEDWKYLVDYFKMKQYQSDQTP